MYDPAAHGAHSTPFSPAVYPAMHMQAATAVLPSEELVPVGHVLQTELSMYPPTGHLQSVA